jgi:hypothetical protein
MPDQKPELKDDDPIQFTFSTYGELKQVFGPARAAGMILTRERKLAQGAGGPNLTRDDIEVALKFLRGEKVGAMSGKALRAFRAYFSGSERARKGCEAYLERLRSGVPTGSDEVES